MARQDPVERLVWANLGLLPRTLRQIGGYYRGMFLISLTIWLLTLPLVMARFHLITPVSLLLNPLAWAPMSLALVSGLATLLLGGWAPPLAWLSGMLCNGCLWFVERLVAAAHWAPWGHFWTPGPAEWWLTGFYAALAAAAAFPRLRPPRRWAVAALAAWITIGFAAAGLRSWSDRGRMTCTFLSVGHGLAVVMEFPSGEAMLYDAGQMGSPHAATRAIAGYSWSRGRSRLDGVVLSHADIDHYNGLPGVLERFSVGAIYVTPQMFQQTNKAVLALHEAIDRSGARLRRVWSGDRLSAGGDCTMEVIHPPQLGVAGRDNANSLTLLVCCRGRRILLTGDLESPGLDDVMAEEPLHCDVLLAPHHGSKRSEPEDLAAWSTPGWTIISNDRRIDLRSVVAAYRAVGSRVLHTGELGAITFTIDAAGIRAAGFLSRRGKTGPPLPSGEGRGEGRRRRRSTSIGQSRGYKYSLPGLPKSVMCPFSASYRSSLLYSTGLDCLR